MKKILNTLLVATIALAFAACDNADDDNGQGPANATYPGNPMEGSGAVLLLLDEDCIDNDNAPNNFTDVQVNDQLADIGLRQPLAYFAANVGEVITLYTGAVGDEGIFAPASIPGSWADAGPADNGSRNYLAPGPGLGAPDGNGDREALLDEIPHVLPLRATGLAMLKGSTVLAVVYDSDISINYSPINANLMGANLGMVAFEVLSVAPRSNTSDSPLPQMEVRILDLSLSQALPLFLFGNAPLPQSSSEPEDTTPPANPPSATFSTAP